MGTRGIEDCVNAINSKRFCSDCETEADLPEMHVGSIDNKGYRG